MMNHIANTRFYSVAVDGDKNRLILSISGAWKKEQDVPKWLEDVKKGLLLLSPGSTVINDLTIMGPSLVTPCLLKLIKKK